MAIGPAGRIGDMDKQRGVFGRGIRLVWRYVRAEPLTYALSLVGATIYAAAAVGTTVVLGRVTNDVILPAFSTGVASDRIRGAAIALLAIGWLRALSIVLRRYFAALTTFRTQASLRRGVTDVYLDVPMAYHRSKPTGELLAHADADIVGATELLNAFPFSVGVIVLIGFAIVSLVQVNLIMTLVAVLLFPTLALVNRLYTKRVEAPPGARRSVSARCHASPTRASTVLSSSRPWAAPTRRSNGLVNRPSNCAKHAWVSVASGRCSNRRSTPFRTSASSSCCSSVPGRSRPASSTPVTSCKASLSSACWPSPCASWASSCRRCRVPSSRSNGSDRVLATESAPSVEGGASLPDGPLAVSFEHVSYAYEPGVPVLTDITFEVAAG